MANWSSSRVGTYEGCPLKYYYSYVRPFRSNVPVNTVYADKGSALHETVEKYYTEMSKDELLQILEEKCKAWNIINDNPENYTEEEFNKKYTEEERPRVYNETAGIDRFLLFWKEFIQPKQENGWIVKQEGEVKKEICGEPFIGKLDLYLESPDGKEFIVYDYKTGKSINASDYKFQQVLYAYLLGLDKGWTIEETASRVRLYIFGPLAEQKKPITDNDKMLASVKQIKYTAEEMKELIDSYIHIISEIKSIDWQEVDPTLLGKESYSCRWCQFLGSIPNKETGFCGCKCTYEKGFRQPRNVSFNPQNWSYHLDLGCKEKPHT